MVDTRSDSDKAEEFANRAQASEQANKKNEVWFKKFIKDIPELDDDLTNYDVRMFNIQVVCKKQLACFENCSNVFLTAPTAADKLNTNNSKNINMLMTHTMNERICPYILKDKPFSTFVCLQTYGPNGNEQRVEILDNVQSIDLLYR